MNAQQIHLVQSTFAQVRPIADVAAVMFYSRLFELDPSLRPLFKHNMREQGAKLMATLGLAVGSLDNPARIIPAVQHLGRRHVGYGVQPHHYETVGRSLLDTLATAFGEQFTPEDEEACTAAYLLLAGVMQAAAAEAEAEAVLVVAEPAYASTPAGLPLAA
jgi:hemoglobin-like flavoprotein